MGVEKKLTLQAKVIPLLGLDMDIFYFNIKHQLQDKGIGTYAMGEGFLGLLASTLGRYSRIAKYIDADQYDLMVLRYSGGDFSLFSRFFRHNAGMIVTEHHTMELPEAYTYETTLPQKALTLLMERFLGPRMIKKCAGLIGVTDEIKEYELGRTGTSMPACTITNGVSVQDIPFSGHAFYNGNMLSLLCVATAFQAWHGLERVLAGLLNYSSRRPFLHLKIVGEVSPKHLQLSSRLLHNKHVSVTFLGRLHGQSLEEVFANAHIAFSSLALFRNGMRQACTLKTREYVARGLPFVIGHCDPDLEGADEFFLRVPSDNSPVNMDDVVAFAERTLNQSCISEAMRQFAEKRLDWKIKMQQMWDFLKSLSKRSNDYDETIPT